MRFAKLKKMEWKLYRCADDNDPGLGILSEFLTTDGYSDVAHDYEKGKGFSYIKWIQDPLADYEASGNMFSLKKIDNNIMIDYSFKDEEDEEDYTYTFTTTKEQMVEIMNTWKHIVRLEKLPEEVTILQNDNGKITFQY